MEGNAAISDEKAEDDIDEFNASCLFESGFSLLVSLASLSSCLKFSSSSEANKTSSIASRSEVSIKNADST